MFGAELAGIGPLAFGVLPTSAQPYLPGFHIATWLNGSSRIRRLGGLGRYPRDMIASLNVQTNVEDVEVHTHIIQNTNDTNVCQRFLTSSQIIGNQRIVLRLC